MQSFAVALMGVLLPLLSGAQSGSSKTPGTMTKMVVRLSGPGIKPGSFAALPKTIYRAGEHYARIEDPPDARQKMQKLTIIAEPDAYSVNVIDRKGTHVRDQGGKNDLHLPAILPLDPKHELAELDGLEFGDELDFFEHAGAQKKAGPIINARVTDEYQLDTPRGPATLVVRAGSDVPILLSWPSKEGIYRYEYTTFEDVPFQPSLFEKPKGIRFSEIPADTSGSGAA